MSENPLVSMFWRGVILIPMRINTHTNEKLFSLQ